MKKKMVSFRVSLELYELLKQVADENDTTLYKLIETIIEDYKDTLKEIK